MTETSKNHQRTEAPPNSNEASPCCSLTTLNLSWNSLGWDANRWLGEKGPYMATDVIAKRYTHKRVTYIILYIILLYYYIIILLYYYIIILLYYYIIILLYYYIIILLYYYIILLYYIIIYYYHSIYIYNMCNQVLCLVLLPRFQ